MDTYKDMEMYGYKDTDRNAWIQGYSDAWLHG